MSRKTILILLTILLSFCFIAAGFAGEKANPRKGKYLFRKNCRVCHKPGGKAQEMGPYHKKVEEWEGAFAPDKYKEFKCNAEWEKPNTKSLNVMPNGKNYLNKISGIFCNI